MDEVAGSLSVSIPVSETESETAVPHPRLASYKPRSNGSCQEERRRKLLQEQKERRREAFNDSRGLIAEIASNDDAEAPQDEMEWSKIKVKRTPHYVDKLMLSEWLIEVPSDLEEYWYMVPCPEGRRTLIVASRGATKAFTKHGYLVATFSSCLPGGHGPGSSSRGVTILDCIWNPGSQTYYILDVLAWNNQPMLDCDTEFRFFWLQTKLPEIEGVSDKSSTNPFPFILLAHYPCHPETVAVVMAMYPPFPDETVGLDGVLFYHTQTHYKPGNTPLVGWLKPYMLGDVLNVGGVAEEYMAARPEGYQDLPHHIEQQKNLVKTKQEKKWLRKRRKSEQMEVLPCEG